jgi:hypothetical protein
MSAGSRTVGTKPVELVSRIRAELQVLYRCLDAAVAEYGPVCELSGRCCRFKEYGHDLFLTMPEAYLLVADAPPPSRALDDGATCPWQDLQGRCTAREARPLGCRVFFCDPTFDARAPELTERVLGRLKQIVTEQAWPWDYARLHDHLHRAREEGRLEIDLVPPATRPEEDPEPPAETLSPRPESEA